MEHRYAPRGACAEIWKRKDPEVLISGPAGTGKSRACLEKLNILALKYPGMKGLIVRKTLASLGPSVVQTFRRDVIKEALSTGSVIFHGGSPQDPPQYRYDNGSTITLGGMDKVTRVMSTEYDIIYVNEAIELTEADWEALTTRLRNGVISYQQLIADTNPSKPSHWLKQRSHTDKLTMLESRHEENPLYFDVNIQTEEIDGVQTEVSRSYDITEVGKAYISKLDSLSGPRYYTHRKGLWVAAEGIIYEEYDPATHLVDRFDIPWEWPRYWSIDFGFNNPFVCQMWARDDDGKLFRYREFYHTKRLVADMAKQILDYVTDDDGIWTEPKPRRIICDHDNEGRATLERELGLSTVKATKTVTDGIQAVQKRLVNQTLFLLRDSLVERDIELEDSKRPICAEDEITGYVWDELKEKPVKEDDHGMDTMRYVVAEFDLKSRSGIRVLS